MVEVGLGSDNDKFDKWDNFLRGVQFLDYADTAEVRKTFLIIWHKFKFFTFFCLITKLLLVG